MACDSSDKLESAVLLYHVCMYACVTYGDCFYTHEWRVTVVTSWRARYFVLCMHVCMYACVTYVILSVHKNGVTVVTSCMYLCR